ncbi:hypothetical protein [Massilia sp. CCM 8734]|uniref:hypothetical protein n=1 Tax=Massilia sp. CCM 8734 TaxID=2609283 RepID=UPI001423C336|nr:hypothetical protein [Massilia sp. CCM 8734]NHZ94531.1 hypothetical protein [Massilia sp. CCM 8734]
MKSSSSTLSVHSPRSAPQATEQAAAAKNIGDMSGKWQMGMIGPRGKVEAQTIVRAYRTGQAVKAHSQMIDQGARWKEHRGANGINRTTQQISHLNLRNLIVRVGKLTEPEIVFRKRFEEADLQITHATNHGLNANGNAVLFSRQKLESINEKIEERIALLDDGTEEKREAEESLIKFDDTNTDVNDILQLATDDNVFFSLGAGPNQKDDSRFGSKLHRFPFDQPAVKQHGLLHPYDVLTGEFSPVEPWLKDVPAFKALSKPDREKIQANLDNHGKTLNAANTLMHGPHLMKGLGLLIIERCRVLPDKLRDDLLQNRDINTLMNGLLRPQILVPHQFFGAPTETIESMRPTANDVSSDSSDSSDASDVEADDSDGSDGSWGSSSNVSSSSSNASSSSSNASSSS